MNNLTAKQQKFVDEYMIDLNATQAAIRAGYSKHTAKDIGCENLSKPNISKAISLAQKKTQLETKISKERVLEGLLKEATFDGPGSTHAARINAWTQLGRHLGLYSADNVKRIDVSRERTNLLQAAIKRKKMVDEIALTSSSKNITQIN